MTFLPPNQAASPIPTGPGGGAASIMSALGLNQGVPSGASALPAGMTAAPNPGGQPMPQPVNGPPGMTAPAPSQPDPLMMLAQQVQQAQPTLGMVQRAAPGLPAPSTMVGPLTALNPTPDAAQAQAMQDVIRALIQG